MLLLKVCTPAGILCHDVPVAIFKIYQKEGVFLLDVTFDQKDIYEEMGSDVSLDLSSIGSYVKDNLMLKVDQNIVSFQIQTIEFSGDHLHLHGTIDMMLSDHSILTITNTCLNSINKHSNIIQLDLMDTSKDFRMHKNRTSIEIHYP